MIQQAANAKGTLARKRIASRMATMDWKGIGISEKNMPMARPEATVSRQGIHKRRSVTGRDMVRHHARSRRCGCLMVRSELRTSFK